MCKRTDRIADKKLTARYLYLSVTDFSFTVFLDLRILPSLFVANMPFDAGHRERCCVKKVGLIIRQNVPAPKTGRSRQIGIREGGLTGGCDSSDGFYYMDRRDSFGGQKPLQLNVFPLYCLSVVYPTTSKDIEIL